MLHTSDAHVTTFETLVARWPGLRAFHVVDERLLDLARESLEAPEIRELLAQRLAELRGADVGLVVCTCSTIGALAEEIGAGGVLRVDRPAAERAVSTGGIVGVVVALESTKAETVQLLQETARAMARPTRTKVLLAERAWDSWEQGDVPGYLKLVAETARELAASADVVLLAQASMAGAVELLQDLDVPVLTTPGEAMERAAHLLEHRL